MKKILIVDNEQGMRELLKERLEASGFQCLTAANGLEALHLVRTERPVLVIMDLVMPHMDGYAVYKALKGNRDTRDIRIVVYSAQRPEVIMEEGIDALDIVDFILKPLDLESLTYLVRKSADAA
jgi:CheY-like chemotaxis protein